MKAPSFQRAVRANINIRLALCGPTGSGKTFSALAIADVLAEGHPIAVIDTERSSADRYADRFAFDACPLVAYSPEAYIAAIEAAESSHYRVLVIDSLSHAWDGAEGLLERVDLIAKRSQKSSFNAWADATPLQRRLVDTILGYPWHVIITMRSKMEYVQEKDERGKTTIRKIGLAPVQRGGIEYEFDLVGELNSEHDLTFTKSRADPLADRVFTKPGKRLGQEILAWARGPASQNAVQKPLAAPAQTAVTLPIAAIPDDADSETIASMLRNGLASCNTDGDFGSWRRIAQPLKPRLEGEHYETLLAAYKERRTEAGL